MNKNVRLRRTDKVINWLYDIYKQDQKRAKKLADVGVIVGYDDTTWSIIVDFDGEELWLRRYDLVYLDKENKNI